MAIRQGDIYHANLRPPTGSGTGFPQYVVVVQSNLFNSSDIKTVVVCELTSVLKRAGAPGNVLLVPGEGGLPKHSVVNVSRLVTLDKKRDLGRRIGALDYERMPEVLEGLHCMPTGECPDS